MPEPQAPTWLPQLQVPVRQAFVPLGQTFPHPPQLDVLVEVSTHEPLQQVCPVPHAAPLPQRQPLLQLSALFLSQAVL